MVFSGSHPHDNRALQIRSCALRLHPPGDPGESLLDLQMYTGDGLWKDSATYKAFISAFSPSSSKRDHAKAVERWMISYSPVQMRLEIMSIEQEENLDLLIPSTDWGRTWQDLGCNTLFDVDMQEQSPESRIRFRSDNLPAGLSIIESSGPADPNWWMVTKAKVDEALSNLQEILQSGCTIEAQAKRSGHMWRNHGRRIYQELTKSTDIEMAVRISGDFSGWSRMPWTSDVHEPSKSIEHKVRLLAAATLQKEWDTQVLKSLSITKCYISLFQAPATHPKGVIATGHLTLAAEEGVPDFQFLSNNATVKVSLWFLVQF